MNKVLSMRRSFFAFCAALIFAVGTPLAHATIVNGTLNFTVDNGSPAPTGSYVFNTTTNNWNNFTVNWDGGCFQFRLVNSGTCRS